MIIFVGGLIGAGKSTIAREFEDDDRCVIDCHNNGPAEDSVADLVHLIRSAASLANFRPVDTN